MIDYTSTDEVFDELSQYVQQYIFGMTLAGHLHPNCHCTYEDGEWKFNTTNPCEKCIAAKAEFDSIR